MLDTSGGPHPGGTGRRADPVARRSDRPRGAGHPGRRPRPGDRSATRSATSAAVGVDVASGVEGPRARRRAATQGPAQGRAVREACPRSPRGPAQPRRVAPTPVDPSLLEADDRGRWGLDRGFGGRYVPETLMAALQQLEAAYAALRHDPRFWAELRELLATFAGRPTPLYRADRLAEQVLARARALRPAPQPAATLRLYLKREDLAHTGAHKINNALGQALLTRRLGKTRVIAETGAGQHGVATATACALLGLPCVVYMGAEDIERQQPNVLRMHALGAEVRPVTSRHRDAQGRDQRGDARLGDERRDDALRPRLARWARTRTRRSCATSSGASATRPRSSSRRSKGRLPDLALACVGGGSNAIGLLSRFIGEPSVRLAVAEAAGDGIATGRHAAALAGGSPGILHGARSMMLQDRDGQVVEAHLGLGGPRLPGRRTAAVRAPSPPAASSSRPRPTTTRSRRWPSPRETEGILPALETAHAIAALPRLLAGAEGSGAPYPAEPSSCSASPAAATRTSRSFGRWRERTGRTDRGAGHVSATRPRAAIASGPRSRAAAREGRAGAHPVRRRGLPGRRDELRGGARVHRRRRRRARGRPAVLGPARGRGDAPARVPGGAQGGRDVRWLASSSSDGSPSLAPASRSCPCATRTRSSAAATAATPPRRLADAGAAGIIVADLTPDEGAPFEAVAADAGLAVVYLVAPTTPAERRREIAERTGGFLYCVSLVGVTGARTSPPSHVARLVRDVKAVLAGPGRRRVRRQPAGPRAGPREGRRRRRHRRVGAGRRARRGWARRRRARRPSCARSGPPALAPQPEGYPRRVSPRPSGSPSRSRPATRRSSPRPPTGRAGRAPARRTRPPSSRCSPTRRATRRSRRSPDSSSRSRSSSTSTSASKVAAGTDFGVPSR